MEESEEGEISGERKKENKGSRLRLMTKCERNFEKKKETSKVRGSDKGENGGKDVRKGGRLEPGSECQVKREEGIGERREGEE